MLRALLKILIFDMLCTCSLCKGLGLLDSWHFVIVQPSGKRCDGLTIFEINHNAGLAFLCAQILHINLFGLWFVS